MIPFDPEKPMVTSGIRVGTPALCARGMGPKELTVVGDLMALALEQPDSEPHLERVHGQVKELARQFPLYAQHLE